MPNLRFTTLQMPPNSNIMCYMYGYYQGAYERHEGASNCTNHLLSNHTLSKTQNLVKRPGLSQAKKKA